MVFRVLAHISVLARTKSLAAPYLLSLGGTMLSPAGLRWQFPGSPAALTPMLQQTCSVNEAWQGTQLSDKLQRGSGNCTMLYEYSSPCVMYVLPSKN